MATFTVTDTVAEAVTFTAKSTTPAVTFTTTPVVTWKAGVPSASMTTVVASAGSAAAGTSVSVTVTEKDAYGNLVTGKTVALTKSAGTHATYTPASKATTNGVAKFTVTDTAPRPSPSPPRTPHQWSPSRPPLGHLEGRPPALTKSTVVVSATTLTAGATA